MEHLTCHECRMAFDITSAEAWNWTVAIRADGSYGDVLCGDCGVLRDSSHITDDSTPARDENHENPHHRQ